MTKQILEQVLFYTKRAAIFDGNVILNSTPPDDQKPFLIGEEWSFILYPESLISNNSAMMASKRHAEQTGLRAFPSRFDNLAEAMEFISQMTSAMPQSAVESFKLVEVNQPRNLDEDSKIYVLTLIRPTLKWGMSPTGYTFDSEVGYYVPTALAKL